MSQSSHGRIKDGHDSLQIYVIRRRRCMPKNKTLRFTKPTNFNDPFDCAASTGEVERKFLDIHECGTTSADKQFRIRNAMGILCLTRNPLNPLMWAHYGESHTGCVIGIDTNEAGLECLTANIIPAERGNLIYTSVRPSLQGLRVPEHNDISSEHEQNILSKIFLHKSIHWAYEEEIRVVRRIEYAPQKKFQDFEIPATAIKEIYFGARYFDRLIDDIDKETPRIHALYNEYKMYICGMHRETWDLVMEPMEDFL